MIAPLGGASADAVPEGSQALVQADGETYGQPTELIPIGLVLNKTALDATGLTYPTNATELMAACANLSGQGKSFMAVAGTVPFSLGLLAQSVSATRVYAQTPDWNAERAAGSVTFADSQGWKDTVQTVLDMAEGGCFQRGFEGAGFDGITQGLGSGSSLAGAIPGNGAAELMAAAAGTTMQVVPVPPADGGTPFILAGPTYALSINAAASDDAKAAAQAFLDWFAQPENSAAFTEISGGINSGGDLTNLLPQYEPIRDLLESTSYAAQPNSGWPNARVYNALAEGLQGAIAGQGDAASVLAAWTPPGSESDRPRRSAPKEIRCRSGDSESPRTGGSAIRLGGERHTPGRASQHTGPRQAITLADAAHRVWTALRRCLLHATCRRMAIAIR